MQELEQEILEYLRERGWDDLRPSDVAKSIVIEGAELLEIFQWKSRDIAETKADEEDMRKIRSELADVLIYCIEMAVLLGMSVEDVVRQKLVHVREKYPAELMRAAKEQGSAHGTDAAYLNIKAEYRKKGL
jgi:NTP pyrophosphatase (non-canonical NTP hydrolase)